MPVRLKTRLFQVQNKHFPDTNLYHVSLSRSAVESWCDETVEIHDAIGAAAEVIFMHSSLRDGKREVRNQKQLPITPYSKFGLELHISLTLHL